MNAPEHWQVGDLALCIKPGIRTRSGCIYRVRRVLLPHTRRQADTGCYVINPSLSLLFEELPDRGRSCGATRFRKVTPPPADAFDREVIELMTSKPAKERA